MPTKLAGATRRLQAAQRNFVKVHKEHARITLKKAKRASGSSVAGRTRRKAGGGKRVMGWDVSPGWKRNELGLALAKAASEAGRRWTGVKKAAKGGRVRRKKASSVAGRTRRKKPIGLARKGYSAASDIGSYSRRYNSGVAGRTRRKKAGGGKRVMGWDVSPGWKKNTNYALKAEVMADNARNEGRRRWAAVKTAAKGGRVRRRR